MKGRSARAIGYFVLIGAIASSFLAIGSSKFSYASHASCYIHSVGNPHWSDNINTVVSKTKFRCTSSGVEQVTGDLYIFRCTSQPEKNYNQMKVGAWGCVKPGDRHFAKPSPGTEFHERRVPGKNQPAIKGNMSHWWVAVSFLISTDYHNGQARVHHFHLYSNIVRIPELGPACVIEVDPGGCDGEGVTPTGPDLTVQILESSDPVARGAPLDYEVLVSSVDGTHSANVYISISGNFTVQELSPSQGTCQGDGEAGLFGCTLGEIESEGEVRIQISGHSNLPGYVIVAASAESQVPDPDYSGNMAVEVTSIEEPPPSRLD